MLNLKVCNQPIINFYIVAEPKPEEDLASKAQVYENFLLLTKNDINLELLKEFPYTTKTVRTKSGREQIIYKCGTKGCGKEFLRT